MRKRYLHNKYGKREEFWDKNWDGDWERKLAISPPVNSCLVTCVMKYLKPNMLLLEGGCGDARYVRHFTDLGVKTVGVDFARATVQRINEHLPNLDVRVGDIRNLDFPEDFFDGYYSGGVIEHFEDGVDPQLAEAHRVLKAGGYFFVTVPHMNLSRRCAAVCFSTRMKIDLDGRKSYHKERVHEFRVEDPPEGFHFHEYVFSTAEMRGFLSSHGFSIVAEMCFSSPFGLLDIEFYHRLIGAGRTQRTIFNKMFAIPLRCARLVEGSDSFFCRVLSDTLGIVFGNLKLYVCRTEK